MRARSMTLACAGMLALVSAPLASFAQSLGAASTFAVEGFAGVTAAGGAGTVVSGDVGSSPSASITGFPPALVAPPFGLHPNDAAAIAAQAADVALFTALGTGACTDNLGAQMNGANIGPGIHCFSSTADLAALGTMTLSGAGTYIFRVPTSLTANVGSTVALAGVDPCSVFWQVGSAATLNGVNFPGNVVAQAGVTLGVGASLTGRALSTAGPVTLSGGNTVGGCSTAAALPPGVQPPTLTKAFSPASILVGGTSTLTITLLNPNATAASLTAALVDTLPAGVVVAALPNASTTCTGTGAVTATAGGGTVTLSVPHAIPAGSGSTPGSCTVSVDVTGSAAGAFLDVIPANALQTTNGSNTLPAQATLTITPLIPVPPVVTPPTVAKAFNAPSVLAGGVSQLVITLSNPNTTVATLTAPLTDTLPGGLVVAPTPNASTTCTGSGAVAATAGGSTVTLPATRTIPAGVGTTPGSCTVTVNVTAPGCGNFINTLAAGSLQTSNGNNAGAAVATLAVTCAVVPLPPPPPAREIPTLSEWAMIGMVLMLAMMGFAAMRRRDF
jgi:hypothetical protein